MTGALYNEIDPFVAQWTRNLIAQGHIAHGTVETRSIADLTPDDVRGPGQRHFFAGLGGWSHALRLAGVPDDADVWTGSCPCQPFSDAGARGGTADERHLWPAWFRLIRECRPAIVFGEQVASKAGLDWLDIVRADMASEGFEFAAADLCAAGVGAPHRRQRLWFVAYARERGREIIRQTRLHDHGQPGDDAARCRTHDRMVDSACQRPEGREAGNDEARDRRPANRGTAGVFGDPGRDRDRQHPGELPSDEAQHEVGTEDSYHASLAAGATRGFWSNAEWLPCVDGVSRPVEPGTQPLAHGIPTRVGRLRAYGNAICAPLAQIFIEAVIESIHEQEQEQP